MSPMAPSAPAPFAAPDAAPDAGAIPALWPGQRKRRGRAVFSKTPRRFLSRAVFFPRFQPASGVAAQYFVANFPDQPSRRNIFQIA